MYFEHKTEDMKMDSIFHSLKILVWVFSSSSLLQNCRHIELVELVYRYKNILKD